MSQGTMLCMHDLAAQLLVSAKLWMLSTTMSSGCAFMHL